MKKVYLAALAALALALGSCDRHAGWSISGDVAGAGDNTLVVEGFNNGSWYVVDSVKAKDGAFSYEAQAPAEYPEIMRLGYKGRYIYFPIDSIDRLSILADTANFDTDYRIDGSAEARGIRAIDSVLNASVAERGARMTVSDKQLKQELFSRAYDDPKVMSVYYLINKTIGQYPLFDLGNQADLRLYGAVAQRFSNELPDDPRTQYLVANYKRAKAAQSEPTVLDATEVNLFDITRADENGKEQSLTDVASKNHVVVLSFTGYALESSPSYTALLNKVYEKYHAQGLEIYQLSFDGDEADWRQNAKNMPWITVWNTTTGGDRPLNDYNVGALPMSFIIVDGTLTERVINPTDLEKTVAKYM